MSKTIWKFPLDVVDHPTLWLPRGAVPLAVQVQNNAPQVWALVDPDAPREWVSMSLHGTGHPVEDDPGQYVGTFQLAGGSLVFHLFAPTEASNR